MKNRARRNRINRKQRLYKIQKGKCVHCGKFMRLRGIHCHATVPMRYASFEHILPKCDHKHTPNNTVLACHQCNQNRGCDELSIDRIQKMQKIAFMASY